MAPRVSLFGVLCGFDAGWRGDQLSHTKLNTMSAGRECCVIEYYSYLAC